MGEFAANCAHANTLTNLRSITLTVPSTSHYTSHHKGSGDNPGARFFDDLHTLLLPCPLTHFQIYSPSIYVDNVRTNSFYSSLVSKHGKTLLRFSMHRMMVSLATIKEICTACQDLEQLFIVVDYREFVGKVFLPSPFSCSRFDAQDDLPGCLLPARKLRTIHINFPQQLEGAHAPPLFFPSDALAFVRQCSPTVTQFGLNARVWQVSFLPCLSTDCHHEFVVGWERYTHGNGRRSDR